MSRPSTTRTRVDEPAAAQAALALPDRIRYLENILDSSPDAIVTTDRERRIIEFSQGAERLFGYRRGELVGRQVELLWIDPTERQKLLNILDQRGSVIDYETRGRTKAGKGIDISVSLSYLRNPRGEVVGTVGITKDIRKRKRMERQLKKLAIGDSLTGLYNRAHFNTRIARDLEDSRRSQKPLTLVLMDLDGFKGYNDQRGHIAGDTVLRGVGRIILHTLRRYVDAAFRFGGDEYTVLLPDLPSEKGFHTAERIRAQVEFALAPEITVSVGVASPAPEDGVREFIKRADAAMYAAKSAGGNRVVVDRSWQPPAPPAPTPTPAQGRA
ncbi:MAG: diguanylate cyclase [Planctomycetes bacterium]|nr:diguanylate cyclase [Planctomycetota bacterium]